METIRREMGMVVSGITRVKRKLSRGVKIITSYFIPLLVGHVPLEEGMEVDPVRVTSTAPSYRGGSRDSPNSRFEEAAFYYCEKLFQGSS